MVRDIRGSPIVNTSDARTYRLPVIRSSALDGRKQRKFDVSSPRSGKELSKAARELMWQRFNCQADAEAALASFQETYKDTLHTHKGQVLAYPQFLRPRGRPRRGVDYPKKAHCQVEIRLFVAREDAKKAWLEPEGAFVLISHLPEEEWSDTALLEEHKGQTKVEQGCRVYRHPILAEGIRPRSARRVEPLGTWPRRPGWLSPSRSTAAGLKARKRKGLSLLRGDRGVERLTSRALLEELGYILVLWHATPEGSGRDVEPDLPLEHPDIPELAGFGPKIYVSPMTGF